MNTSVLKKSPLFETFNENELKQLESAALPVEIITGDPVFSEGSVSDALFFIQQGSVKVVKAAAQDEQAMRELSANTVIGELGLLDGAPRAASVIAKENLKLIKIPYQSLETIFEKNPAVGMKFYKRLGTIISNRIRTTTNDLAQLKDLKLKHL